MARSARGDVRQGAAIFVGSDETTGQRVSFRLVAARRLLLQIVGANIGNADRALQPPTSSSLGDERRVPSLLLSTTARDPTAPSQWGASADDRSQLMPASGSYAAIHERV
jgi:hypothetical protein